MCYLDIINEKQPGNPNFNLEINEFQTCYVCGYDKYEDEQVCRKCIEYIDDFFNEMEKKGIDIESEFYIQQIIYKGHIIYVAIIDSLFAPSISLIPIHFELNQKIIDILTQYDSMPEFSKRNFHGEYHILTTKETTNFNEIFNKI